MPDEAADERAEAPDPDIRAYAGASGTPATLADGRQWLLADGGLGNLLDEARDRIFDGIMIRGSVRNADVCFAAWVLLKANYRLTIEEGRALIFGADMAALTRAVREALFGPAEPPRTYTTWALASLLANGIDPAAVPVDIRPQVLDLLVATRRTIPAGEYCESVARATAFEGLKAMAKPIS